MSSSHDIALGSWGFENLKRENFFSIFHNAGTLGWEPSNETGQLKRQGRLKEVLL